MTSLFGTHTASSTGRNTRTRLSCGSGLSDISSYCSSLSDVRPNSGYRRSRSDMNDVFGSQRSGLDTSDKSAGSRMLMSPESVVSTSRPVSAASRAASTHVNSGHLSGGLSGNRSTSVVINVAEGQSSAKKTIKTAVKVESDPSRRQLSSSPNSQSPMLFKENDAKVKSNQKFPALGVLPKLLVKSKKDPYSPKSLSSVVSGRSETPRSGSLRNITLSASSERRSRSRASVNKLNRTGVIIGSWHPLM